MVTGIMSVVLEKERENMKQNEFNSIASWQQIEIVSRNANFLSCLFIASEEYFRIYRTVYLSRLDELTARQSMNQLLVAHTEDGKNAVIYDPS
ncbi:hypothetical protein T4E_6141 [Trichinella pseudospiralis]|uniref:Uncharacterized protein n=1 Tax=Trichinella pseudospiralis TaxID=6337 RepID=A0A0V0YDG1_TRIPS|nr:hypothetical protein T4E_6141 [Trichinella pseudospiralis]